MRHYKFYFLDDSGHMLRAEDHMYRDDLAALEAAKKLHASEAIDIWDQVRRVARVKPGDRPASPSDPISG